MKDKLDTLLKVSLFQLELAFKWKIIDRYKSNLHWKNIKSILEKDNRMKFSIFCRSDDLIYWSNNLTIKDYSFIRLDYVYPSRWFKIFDKSCMINVTLDSQSIIS